MKAGRVRRRWVLVLCVAGVLALGSSDRASVTIRVQDHSEGGLVEVPPVRSLILDARGFQFLGDRLDDVPPPDTIAVQLIHDGRSDYYSASLPAGDRLVELGPETLRAHQAPAFVGYPSGADVFILVGRQPSPSSLDDGIFSHDWSLLVKVR